MNTEKPNRQTDELEQDFSDVDLALDIDPEPDVTVEQFGSELVPHVTAEAFGSELAPDVVFAEDDALAQVETEEKPAQISHKKRLKVADPNSGAAVLFDWVRCVVLAIPIVVICLTFLFRLVEVDGKSMMDTLENADKVIVTDMFYQPHNNDIIVISHATNYNKPIIKRVIAIGGQTVKLDFDNEKIYVDGIALVEPYIKGTTFSGIGRFDSDYLDKDEDGNFTVPEGKLFVLGDNRMVSLDSRSPEIGLINVNDVIGKAQFVAFPFNRIGNVYDK